MPDYIWIGEEDVQCEIAIEPLGRGKPKLFRATALRIQRDGLLPLAFRDGRPVEYVETSEVDAMARAKLFLDRRFGFGAVSESEGETAGMRLFELQRVPDYLTIAAYGRYGCPVCRIGEPDEDKLAHWIEHAQREHGYVIVSDTQEPAPGLPDVGRHFRVLRLRHTSVAPEPPRGPEPEPANVSEPSEQ